jgi:hypothetical protein
MRWEKFALPPFSCMPDFQHELPIYVLRHAPRAVRQVLRSFLTNIEISEETPVRAESTNFVDIAPVDYHSDGVFTIGDPVERTLLVEVQRRIDTRKPYAWTQYMAALFAEYEAPVELIVFVEDSTVARWARKAIHVGSSLSWRPTVIGPEELASKRHREALRQSPELSLLAIQLCVSSEQVAPEVITHTAQWLSHTDELADEDARLYRDIIRNAVSGATRTLVEQIMGVSNQPFESSYFQRLRREWREEGRELGLQKAAAQSLLTVLSARGFALTDEQRLRIEECNNLELLQQWLRKAATASSVKEVFE